MTLEILKLKGTERFYDERHQYFVRGTGYCFYNPERGYLSFKHDHKPNEPKYPYIPRGGKKGLQKILDAGGLLSFDEVEWLKAD